MSFIHIVLSPFICFSFLISPPPIHTVLPRGGFHFSACPLGSLPPGWYRDWRRPAEPGCGLVPSGGCALGGSICTVVPLRPSHPLTWRWSFPWSLAPSPQPVQEQGQTESSSGDSGLAAWEF